MFKADQYEEAIQWYERALLVNHVNAESLMGLGDAYYAIGQTKEAIDAYLETWDLDPELGIQPLIKVYQERGNFIAVEELLEQMLELYPISPDRLFWYKELGDSYRSHGEYDRAIEQFIEVIHEYPNRPNLHLTLGWIYFDQGDNYHLASEEFEKTIQLDEGIAESYYGLARINFREDKFQEADKYFEEAINRSPSNRWYYLERGNNARSAGNLENAIRIYKQVLDMYPDFSYGYYHLALAYLMDGMIDKSIQSIEFALDYIDNPNDQFFARAGNIYRAAGFSEKAINVYRLALSINPDNEIATQGLTSLDGK